MNVTATSGTAGATGSITDAFDFGEQKELFLQLLVAQLKNQDPTNPMDQKDMMGQMAQLTSVEQMTNMAKTLEALQTNSTFSQGVALIGKHVDYVTNDATTYNAEVQSVKVAGGVVKLVLGDGNEVNVSDVVMVR